MGDAPPPPQFSSASLWRLSEPPPYGGAEGASRDALGEQFTMLWFNDALQRWVVGVAPGPLDLQWGCHPLARS